MEKVSNLHNLLEDSLTTLNQMLAQSRLQTEKPFPELNTVRSPFAGAG
jgi:hypothetical protein